MRIIKDIVKMIVGLFRVIIIVIIDKFTEEKDDGKIHCHFNR
jgi:hypothetical protein